ncbi:MAG: DUF748 domain-containing protein, partial [Candidatus Omnitrophica bacterium]|nr:DUF748 domain-containing protein [Candidatus Omnitrophota bacterium]
MKKKIFIILLALVFLAGIGLFYLNKVVLPTKIKSLVIKSLQEATQKKVSLDSVEINIFKGLVLKNLKLYDGTRTLLSLKEGSCVFILPLIFKKKIVLSNVNLLSPVVFLERRPDNSLNLADLFLQKQTKKGKLGFGVFIRKISITNGRIDFQDDTFSPAFTKSIDKLNARVFLSLPANVKFDFNTYIPGNQRIEISGNGIFNIATSELQ